MPSANGRAKRNEATMWLLMIPQKWDSDECLLWPYGKSGTYGAYMKGMAHTAVCRLTHGDPPTEHHQVAHSCGVRLCVNPRHLRWATCAENQADRLLHGTDWRGEKHGRSKFTTTQVLAICNDERPARIIADEYGTDQRYVRKLRSGERWKHVGR